MTPWNVPDARRFVTGLEAVGMAELPLFRGNATSVEIEEGIEIERADDATLTFWERLIRLTAARTGVIPARVRIRGRLRALGAASGPVLLAVRAAGESHWRVLLAPPGATARRILERIPSPEGVGRAA